MPPSRKSLSIVQVEKCLSLRCLLCPCSPSSFSWAIFDKFKDKTWRPLWLRKNLCGYNKGRLSYSDDVSKSLTIYHRDWWDYYRRKYHIDWCFFWAKVFITGKFKLYYVGYLMYCFSSDYHWQSLSIEEMGVLSLIRKWQLLSN